MKITVTVSRTAEIDTERDWDSSTREYLINTLREEFGLDGTTANAAQIEAALRVMLDDDIDQVVGDYGPSTEDYDLQVAHDETLFIPKEESE